MAHSVPLKSSYDYHGSHATKKGKQCRKDAKSHKCQKDGQRRLISLNMSAGQQIFFLNIGIQICYAAYSCQELAA